MPERIILCRHALRHDTINKQWLFTSPTPYDTPLAIPRGFEDARKCGQQIIDQQPDLPKQIFLHCSPFLRCAQTAGEISKVIAKQKSCDITIRLDAVFGEWLTEDYYAEIIPPPPDGHHSIAENSLNWLRNTDTSNGVFGRSMSISTYQNKVQTPHELSPYKIDDQWPLDNFGKSGEYGEEWSDMHERVCHGLQRLLDFYESVPGNFMVILVTHGAICNSLLGFLSNKPLLQKIGLSSFAIAERDRQNEKEWHIKIQSKERDGLGRENNTIMHPETLNKDLLGVPDSSGKTRKFSAAGISPSQTPPEDHSPLFSSTNTLLAFSDPNKQMQSRYFAGSPTISLASSLEEGEDTGPSFMLSFDRQN